MIGQIFKDERGEVGGGADPDVSDHPRSGDRRVLQLRQGQIRPAVAPEAAGVAGLDMHPLDTVDRTEFVRSQAGIGLCNITKCCTEVCPEHIHITDNGIIPMKERAVDRKYDPLFAVTSLWRQPGREEVASRPGAGVGWSGRPMPPDAEGMYIRTLSAEPAPAPEPAPEPAGAAPATDGGSSADGAEPDRTAAGEPADQREHVD